MSGFMKIGLVILCVLGIQTLKGQDTICKLSGECFVAEIWSQNKSKLIVALAADSFVSSHSIKKKELSYVKYKNGMLDVYQSDLRVPVDTHKIYRTQDGYMYKQREISNKEILELVRVYPYMNKRQEMLSLHKQVRRNNRNRKLFAIIGIAAVPVGVLPVLAYSSLGHSDSAVTIGAVYFGLGSLLVGISQFCNFTYHSTKKELVKVYNTF